MDALKLLEQDHDEAKKLFKQIEEAKGAKAGQLWTELKDALTLHEEMEETHLYPPLKEVETTEDLVLESYEEHHVMDLLIEEISALDPSDERWHPKVKVLQENTEHHIEEEETGLFPKVRKIWDVKKREEIGARMQEMKQQKQQKRRAA
jgi:hemerythrin superfamily protein